MNAGFEMNLTQIDGDYFTGFDKVGWYGGIRGIVNLNYRTSINMELLFFSSKFWVVSLGCVVAVWEQFVLSSNIQFII